MQLNRIIQENWLYAIKIHKLRLSICAHITRNADARTTCNSQNFCQLIWRFNLALHKFLSLDKWILYLGQVLHFSNFRPHILSSSMTLFISGNLFAIPYMKFIYMFLIFKSIYHTPTCLKLLVWKNHYCNSSKTGQKFPLFTLSTHGILSERWRLFKTCYR